MPGGCCIWASIGGAFWSERVATFSRRGDGFTFPTERFEAFGIDFSGVRHCAGAPGVRDFIEYDAQMNKKRIGYLEPSNTPLEMTAAYGDMPPAYFAAAKGFMISGGFPENCAALCEKLPARIVTGLDAGIGPGSKARYDEWRALLARIDCILFSERELTYLCGIEPLREPADYLPLMKKLCAGKTRVFCLKLGAAGVLAYSAGQDRAWLLPTAAKRVVDATGCGDAFCGGFMAGYVNGEGIFGSCAKGIVSSSIVIGHIGSDFFTQIEKAQAHERLADYLRANDEEKCRVY